MANSSSTIKNDTSVGSFQTHQWPHEALAQIEPVIRPPIPKMRDMWMAT